MGRPGSGPCVQPRPRRPRPQNLPVIRQCRWLQHQRREERLPWAPEVLPLASSLAAPLALLSVPSVPAVFTFGLSIPVFAAVGSGCGVVAGAAVGGAAGLVGGGATGYGAYTKREAIGRTVTNTMTKVDGCAKYTREAASSSASYVRARLVGGTGGTAD